MKTLVSLFVLGLCFTLTPVMLAEEEAKEILCGGWQIQPILDAPSLEVFQKGAALVKDYRLKPISCATQVVAGLNYCFLCAAQPEKMGETGSFAVLNLYVNLQGKVEMTGFRL
ncbi:MAG: hypothetical protein Q4E67_01710, partial [Planctomycetia bacterium]|nr:hypothetical protein [Planctomycetia bacterium]